MGTLGSAADLFVTYRFLRALTTPFIKTDAYKYGIIDKAGVPLKKKKDLQTANEKSSYTMFDRMIFRMKRLIEKLPFGKTRLASFATALWLIKENTTISDMDKLEQMFTEQFLSDVDLYEKQELSEHCTDGWTMQAGRYQIIDEALLEMNELDNSNDIVTIKEQDTVPFQSVLGINLYNAYIGKQKIVVAHDLIKKI